jgi:cytochrome d ubiquinol oxidase subunit I
MLVAVAGWPAGGAAAGPPMRCCDGCCGLVGMAFSGWVATLAGWYVTEIGRQPFIVHGLLRTAEVASAVPAPTSR